MRARTVSGGRGLGAALLLAAAAATAACGRSVVFQLFEAEAETSGGTSGGSSSGSSSGRTTSGGTSGGTSRASSGTSTTGSSSGTSGVGSTSSASSGASGSSTNGTSTSGGSTSSGGSSSGSISTSGSSSGSTSGSTSGSSSGGSSGACQPNTGPLLDLPPCHTTADCPCPTVCVFDPLYQQQDCEYPCQASADCPFIETACAGNGFCPPNPCADGDDAGPQNGTIDGTCTIAGQGPGSCVPVIAPNGSEVGLCLQGGDTFGSCAVPGQRSTPTLDCAAGMVCLPAPSQCETLCNPFLADTCSFGQVCKQPEPSNPLLGVCSPGSGSSSGGSGSTSSGNSSSGSSGGPPVCNPAAPIVEFLPCTNVAGCGCPLVCVSDPLAVEGGQGKVCEYPCQQISQCPDLLTVCNGANCHINACGGGTGNGSYNSTCNVVGVNDGTCIPLEQANGTTSGVCAQGGTAVTTCNADANRNELSQDCIAGMVCIGGAIGTGGVCGDVCDPNQGGPCPAGQDCAFTVDDPLAGACYTP